MSQSPQQMHLCDPRSHPHSQHLRAAATIVATAATISNTGMPMVSKHRTPKGSIDDRHVRTTPPTHIVHATKILPPTLTAASTQVYRLRATPLDGFCELRRSSALRSLSRCVRYSLGPTPLWQAGPAQSVPIPAFGARERTRTASTQLVRTACGIPTAILGWFAGCQKLLAG